MGRGVNCIHSVVVSRIGRKSTTRCRRKSQFNSPQDIIKSSFCCWIWGSYSSGYDVMFRDVTPCSLIWHFRGSCLLVTCLAYSSILKIHFFKISVNFYQTTHCHIPLEYSARVFSVFLYVLCLIFLYWIWYKEIVFLEYRHVLMCIKWFYGCRQPARKHKINAVWRDPRKEISLLREPPNFKLYYWNEGNISNYIWTLYFFFQIVVF